MIKSNIELLRKGEMICRSSSFCYLSDIGVHGRFFGGAQMAELDTTCSVFAAEILDTPWIVTKTMNVEFIKGISANQIYKVYVGIKKIGNTSITLNAEIRIHSVDTEKEALALRCETTFVRINEYGETIRISDTVRNKYPERSVRTEKES